jgi:hypothetical protein
VLLQHQKKNHFKLTGKKMTTHFTVKLKSKKRENNNRNKDTTTGRRIPEEGSFGGIFLQ